MNDDKDPQSNPWVKSALIWAGVILALLLFVTMFDSRTATQGGTAIAYSDFRQKVATGSVKEVSIAPDRITGTLDNSQRFSTVPVTDPGLTTLLDENNVKYSGEKEEQPSFWMILLYQSLPFVL
ncbi:MAG: ATP-dependent metallopeptidase FtsH/Yme1/Tma family protein, partial [Sphingobium sp.]